MKRMWSKNELKQIANGQVQEQVSSGQLQNVKVFEDIVDKDGHKRFVEGDITTNEVTGITYSYTKWSLSGTHLIFVMAGKIAANTVISAYSLKGLISPPKWVFDKLIPQKSVFLDYKVIPTSTSGASPTNTFINVYAYKDDGLEKIIVENLDAYACGEEDEYFRIVFDFVIDNE